jgi:hypothetical protein
MLHSQSCLRWCRQTKLVHLPGGGARTMPDTSGRLEDIRKDLHKSSRREHTVERDLPPEERRRGEEYVQLRPIVWDNPGPGIPFSNNVVIIGDGNKHLHHTAADAYGRDQRNDLQTAKVD